MTDGSFARPGVLALPPSAASPSTPALRPRLATLAGMPTAPPRQEVVVPPPPPSVPPPLPEAALTGHYERQQGAQRDAVTDTQLPSLEALQSFAQVLMSKQEVEPPSSPKVEWITPPVELDSLAKTLSAALGDDDPTADSDRPSSPPTVRTVPPPERGIEASQWSLRGPLGLLAAAVALATVLIGSVVAGSLRGPSPSHSLAASSVGLTSQAIRMAAEVADRGQSTADQVLDAQPPSQGTIVASAGKRRCQLWVAGTPYGKAGTARAAVPAGEHIVACRLQSGQTLLRRVYVEAGDTLYESF